MPNETYAEVAIVDYGLGNLYSVKHACTHAGLRARITSDPAEIRGADATVLPGVGAFGDAMATLERLDLSGAIRDVVAAGKPLVGICLGLQLLMSESEEFGCHRGLGIIEGTVVKFAEPRRGDRRLKVPHIGWNGVHRIPYLDATAEDPWSDTILRGMADGEALYFVHSYVVKPTQPGTRLSATTYGDIEFCSSLRYRNITACQFHPERSGPKGLNIYRNLAEQIHGGSKERVRAQTG